MKWRVVRRLRLSIHTETVSEHRYKWAAWLSLFFHNSIWQPCHIEEV
jgi:hypothetical protein